jgi:hypothetical protein
MDDQRGIAFLLAVFRSQPCMGLAQPPGSGEADDFNQKVL